MNTITYTPIDDGSKVELQFQFDRHIVDTIKQIPGKWFHGDSKTWSIPADRLDTLRQDLPDVRFVDGQFADAEERLRQVLGAEPIVAEDVLDLAQQIKALTDRLVAALGQ